MFQHSRVLSAMALMAITGAVCSAQSVISAHSGTVHYFEGDVSIDGTPVQSQVGKFSVIKEQGVLRTGQGRAEILLTPGVFLRVGENSSIKLLDNRLISTRVDILSGTAVVESDDPETSVKDSPVTLLYKDYEIQMIKHGLLEITSDPAQMKVYKGEAVVRTTGSEDRATVKEGREIPFSAALVTEKFDDKVGDDLFLWARDRSQSISTANMSSARTINSLSSGGSGFGSGIGSGLGYGGYGYGGLGYGGLAAGGLGYGGYGYGGMGAWNGGWYFNPYFSMFTYVPMAGTYFNAFGYGFFSPGSIYNYYSPSSYWYGAGGARGGFSGRAVAGLPGATTKAAPLSNLRAGMANGGSFARIGGPVMPGGAGGFAGRAVGGRGGMSARGGAGGHASGGGGHGGGGGHR